MLAPHHPALRCCAPLPLAYPTTPPPRLPCLQDPRAVQQRLVEQQRKAARRAAVARASRNTAKGKNKGKRKGDTSGSVGGGGVWG